MPVGVVTSGLVRRYSLVLQTCLGEGSILVELVVLRHVERLWLVTRSLVVVVVRDESTSNGGQCHCLRLTSSPLTVVRSFVRSIDRRSSFWSSHSLFTTPDWWWLSFGGEIP